MFEARYPNCLDCPVRRHGIFSELPAEQVAELQTARTIDEYNAGHVLFYQGHHPLAVYSILSGHLKIYESDAEGRRHVLRLAGPGEMVGHEALLNQKTYNASAEALDDCQVCILPGARLLSVLQQNPPALVKLVQRLHQELECARTEREYIVRKPVPARLAMLLLDLFKRFGRRAKGRMEIDLRLSRAELADLAGTTPETVMRVLNRFKRAGLIGLPRAQSIFLLDEAGLKVFATAA